MSADTKIKTHRSQYWLLKIASHLFVDFQKSQKKGNNIDMHRGVGELSRDYACINFVLPRMRV